MYMRQCSHTVAQRIYEPLCAKKEKELMGINFKRILIILVFQFISCQSDRTTIQKDIEEINIYLEESIKLYTFTNYYCLNKHNPPFEKKYYQFLDYSKVFEDDLERNLEDKVKIKSLDEKFENGILKYFKEYDKNIISLEERTKKNSSLNNEYRSDFLISEYLRYKLDME